MDDSDKITRLEQRVSDLETTLRETRTVLSEALGREAAFQNAVTAMIRSNLNAQVFFDRLSESPEFPTEYQTCYSKNEHFLRSFEAAMEKLKRLARHAADARAFWHSPLIRVDNKR